MGPSYSQANYKFTALIADPESNTRLRLKQAMLTVPRFGEVQQFSDLHAALAKLGMGFHCDTVFISHRFAEDEIKSFIDQAKNSSGGADSAYIMVLRTRDQDNSIVANSMIIGFNGFLFEPYSVDSLMEMTVLATKVKKDRQVSRDRAAVSLLVNEIMKQLDLVACIRASGYSVSRSGERLHELCQQLKAMPEDGWKERMEVLVNTMIDAKPPAGSMQVKKYSGVSNRVKSRMARKLESKSS